MTTSRQFSEPAPVLLYDGECGLCNRAVRLLLRLDRGERLCFARLQSDAGQAYLRAHGLPTKDFSTLVFVSDWPAGNAAPLLRTDGVVGALRAAGRPGLAGTLAVIPRGLRDAGYKLVARTRYAIFGPWKQCPLPRPEWAARFLD